MVWFSDEEFWFYGAEFLDGFEGRAEPQGVELLCEVVGRQPVPHVAAQVVDRAVMEVSGGRLLDGADHPFGLVHGW